MNVKVCRPSTVVGYHSRRSDLSRPQELHVLSGASKPEDHPQLCSCTGLAAARQLQSFGHAVVVVEGNCRPGGRVYTKKLEVSLQKLELSQPQSLACALSACWRWVGVTTCAPTIITILTGSKILVLAKPICCAARGRVW